MFGVHSNVHIRVMVNHKMVDSDVLRLLSGSDLPPSLYQVPGVNRTTVWFRFIESKIILRALSLSQGAGNI